MIANRATSQNLKGGTKKIRHQKKKKTLKMASFGPGFWPSLQHYLPFKNPYSLTTFFLIFKKNYLFWCIMVAI
jgi:hypothetical protein